VKKFWWAMGMGLSFGLGCSDAPGTYTAVEGESDEGVFSLRDWSDVVALGSLQEVSLGLPATGLTSRCGFVGESTCPVNQEWFELIEIKSLDPEVLSIERVSDPEEKTTSSVVFWVRSRSPGTARFEAEVVTAETKTKLTDSFSIRTDAADRVEFIGARQSEGSLFGDCSGTHVVEGADFRFRTKRYNNDDELVGSDTVQEHWLFGVQGPATLIGDFSKPLYAIGVETTGAGDVRLTSELSLEDALTVVVPASAIDDGTVVDSLNGEAGRVSTSFKIQVTARAQGHGICAGPVDAEFVSETPDVCTVNRQSAQRGGTFIRGEEAGQCRVQVSIPGSSWSGTTLNYEII